MPEQRRPSATTQERMARRRTTILDAGLKILEGRRSKLILQDLQPTIVAQAAGVSVGTFYQYFQNDSFLEALLEYALERQDNPQIRVAAETFGKALSGGASFSEAMIVATTAVMHFQDTNSTFPLQLVVWENAQSDIEQARRLGRMYERVNQSGVGIFEIVVSSAGRKFRPPFTANTVSVCFSAVMEGLAMRRGIDSSAVPDELLGQLLLAICELLTAPAADDRDVGALFQDLDAGWPVEVMAQLMGGSEAT